MPHLLQAEFLTFWRFDGQCFTDGLTTLLGVFPDVVVTPLNIPNGVDDPVWRDPQGAHVSVKLPYELWSNMIQVQQWFDTYGKEDGLMPWALVDQGSFVLDSTGNPTGDPIRWDWVPPQAKARQILTDPDTSAKNRAARDKFLRRREEAVPEPVVAPVVEVPVVEPDAKAEL